MDFYGFSNGFVCFIAAMESDADKIPHRGHELLNVLARLGGSARNAQIAQVMGVSEETVRRLVKGLAQAGRVERVHGGTYLRGSPDTPMYSGALEQNSSEKTEIARAALDLVEDGMTVFINVGSTTTYVAEQLRERKSLIVVTNSIAAVAALADHNNNRVFMAGGEILPSERGTFGSATEEFARQFNYDLVIFGSDAISAKHGFLASNPDEASLTRVLTNQSEKAVVTADSRKFSTRAPMVACDPKNVTHLVTDQSPDVGLLEALDGWGIEVRIAQSLSKK
ncbi:DeoR/GlpR family DNA-binding transcription regulator [Falsiruegeria mediterranea]|jgi:DeoR family transcriptional regulator, glycerol-3-phosphate regulon repressor|uniref:Glucitol operon repressor n=1 Tax=Falsiruegeria mediterranea M17 TaxID=1200281 RepID=A0A2R8CDK9_9RHOB|nr:DeoR/GlpR family DNA-binding transcription regulator [Falsiruegeria mediterranea]SPJ30543.1 Glucitol operon repressor [Falsiruegeria mediterranea M17]